MQTESKNIKETLEPILQVLSDLGGKFTFMDDEGRQFVLAPQETLEREKEDRASEQQLAFPQVDRVADAIRKNIDPEIGDDVIDRINRDIAMTTAREQFEQEDEIDDIAESVTEDDDLTMYAPPPVPRIRFESVRGDLNPHLQD